MGQMEELSKKRIQEVRGEMADGHVKRDDGKGYTDLLTLMGEVPSPVSTSGLVTCHTDTVQS
jgi:hypothetical protein